ncbi:hypothetical protein B0H13DRAFT_1998353 [Mycena leptocephala]|nr:hypothetical protein B0H13DRAFT_2109014 [Mycena leptocephala]KAJ7916115.1 hypothetical protein B0H13DRAFT_1998353 [Mycena leptocephala]
MHYVRSTPCPALLHVVLFLVILVRAHLHTTYLSLALPVPAGGTLTIDIPPHLHPITLSSSSFLHTPALYLAATTVN